MIGEIHVTFEESGNVEVKIEGKINYMQIYGVAATLHEIARTQHMESQMQAMGQRLSVARGLPGVPKGD